MVFRQYFLGWEGPDRRIGRPGNDKMIPAVAVQRDTALHGCRTENRLIVCHGCPAADLNPQARMNLAFSLLPVFEHIVS